MAGKREVQEVEELKTTPTRKNVYGSAKNQVKPVAELKKRMQAGKVGDEAWSPSKNRVVSKTVMSKRSSGK